MSAEYNNTVVTQLVFHFSFVFGLRLLLIPSPFCVGTHDWSLFQAL